MIPLPDALETDRLVIRPFEEDDLDAYLTFMTDEVATRYLLFADEHRTAAGATELFEAVRASYGSEAPIFAYAVAEKADNTFVGSCGLAELDVPGRLECYYSLLRAYWGRGYAAEATAALLRYGLAQEGVDEIWAFMSPENPRSAGVAERAGLEDRGLRTHPVHGLEGRAYATPGARG